MENDHQVAFVKKAEQPDMIASLLYADLVQTIGPNNVFQIRFGDPRQFLDQRQRPKDLMLQLFSLSVKKFLKMLLVKENSPDAL